MRAMLGFVLIGAVSSMTLGCGGEAHRCGLVQPCGGDPVGEWTFVDACTDQPSGNAALEAEFAQACPAVEGEGVSIAVSGALSLRADMTYAASLIVTASANIRFPLSCLGGLTCAALSEAFTEQVRMDPGAGLASFTCTGTSSCLCTMVAAPMGAGNSGTYVTSASTFMTIPNDGSPTDPREYCVQGDRLHFLEVGTTMDMGPMGRVTILSDLVATRSP
jgi:hypothetical protein